MRLTREPPSSRRCRAMPAPSSAPSPMTRAPSTRGSRPTAASGPGPRPRERSASACPPTATSGRWRRCPPAWTTWRARPSVVEPGATASASSVIAGGSVTISGVGFAPGETVDVTLHSTPVALGSFTADDAGAVEAPVAIPAVHRAGVHTIELVGQTSGVEASVEIEVVAAGPRAGRRGRAAADRLGRRRAHADRDGAPRGRRRPRRGEPSPARGGAGDLMTSRTRRAAPRPRGRGRRAGFGDRAVGRRRPRRPRRPSPAPAPTRRGSPSSSTSPTFGDGVRGAMCAPTRAIGLRRPHAGGVHVRRDHAVPGPALPDQR